jgi:hypothetical protein
MSTFMKGMYVLPKLAAGEALNKYIERTGTYAGMPSMLVSTRKLLNRPHTALDGMPNGIQEFFDLWGNQVSTLDDLINNHTLWGFYCHGLPKERYEEQWNRLLHRLPGPVRLTRAPTLFGSTNHIQLQCPKCEEQAQKDLGFSYFHRRLAVPYVSICALHRIELTSAGTQLKLFDQNCISKPSAYQVGMAWNLAKRLEYCLDISPESSKYNKESVIKTLKCTGWLGANDRLRLDSFVNEFQRFFMNAFADVRLSILCGHEEYIKNALRALMRDDHGVYPIWCILISWVAEACPCQITSSAKNTVKAVKSISSIKRDDIENTLATFEATPAAAQQLNISKEQLRTLCRLYGIPLQRRPKKIDAHLREEILKALKEGISVDVLTVRFAVSLSALYRELRATPEILLPRKRKLLNHIQQCKQDWKAISATSPDKSQTQLRKENPAVWAVLYRHERTWLIAQHTHKIARQGRKVKRYHPALLNKVITSVTEAESQCTTGAAPPKRKSSYSLSKLIGLTEDQYSALTINQLITDKAETRKEFIDRRIRYAISKGISINSPLWKLAKAAGLREKTITAFADVGNNEETETRKI